MVSVKDGQIVEIGPDGDEAVWGTILDWEPPGRIRLTWHPGSSSERATELEVRFVEVVDGQTLVTLEHRGWEVMADPTAARAEYRTGWVGVLTRYADLTSDTAEPSAANEANEVEVWLVLLHTPGMAIGAAERIFTHPDFPEHLAFLRRLRDEGLLVAAGPMGADGDGMTVVRLPDASAVPELVRRAQEDDLSIPRGVLDVHIRPWHVSLTGSAA